MKNLIWFVLFLVGCNSPAVESTLAWQKAMIDGSVDVVEATKAVEVKQDEAIVILKENTTALAAIKSQIDSLEASVVSSTPNGKEVIQSVPPESPAKANTQQALLNVATPGAFSRVASDGTVLRWNVDGNWNPTILETSRHLGEDHGINTNGMTHQQMADIHADLHDGKTSGGAPVGAIFPNNRTSGITSQRTSVRSLPQRISFFGRAKYSTRQSCPSGRCPTR
jgi:hypothetical protein